MVLLFRRSKQTLNNINRFRRARFNYVGFVNSRYMLGGEAHILVKVNSLDEVLSPYSAPESPWLNDDFLAYVSNCANHIPVEEAIVLEFRGYNFSTTERELITNLIHAHFGFELAERELELRLNLRRSFALLVFFTISSIIFFVMAIKTEWVFAEIPAVALWFALWEFFNTFWLERSDLKLTKLEAGQLTSMKIVFDEVAALL